MSNIKMGLTIEEAAECTGIGRNTMRKLVDWGKLPVLKVGRKAIIRRDTLERFMSSVGRAVFSRSVQVFTGQNSGRALLPFGIFGKKGGGCGQRYTAVEQHNTGGRSWQHEVSFSYKKRHRSRSLSPLLFVD